MDVDRIAKQMQWAHCRDQALLKEATYRSLYGGVEMTHEQREQFLREWIAEHPQPEEE